MAEKRMAGHPHHKGGGMGYFEREHWQKDMADVQMQDKRYCSEMGAPEELKGQVDKLASYVKKNAMKY